MTGGSCPTPFPIGWFRVLDSDDLPEGAVVPLRWFERNLVAFRDSAGPRVVDAHCPHLGAHLGYGGVVADGCVVCPFHGWRFDGDGACHGTPYGDRVPARVRLGAYPTDEVNGSVVIHHDPRGDEPTWHIPEIGARPEDGWTEVHRRTWRIRTQVQVVCENGLDPAHHLSVHNADHLPEAGGRPDGHRFLGRFGTTYAPPEGLENPIPMVLDFVDVGLGFTAFEQHVDVDGMDLHQRGHSYLTPIDATTIEALFAVQTRSLGDPELTAMLDEIVTARVWEAIEEDIPIWEHLEYRHSEVGLGGPTHRANLTRSDHHIAVFRRWARQFDPDDLAAAAS